eukprot:scaffold764_cov408-Prasinococcus_capsulatus_cf.AAC.9
MGEEDNTTAAGKRQSLSSFMVLKNFPRELVVGSGQKAIQVLPGRQELYSSIHFLIKVCTSSLSLGGGREPLA